MEYKCLIFFIFVKNESLSFIRHINKKILKLVKLISILSFLRLTYERKKRRRKKPGFIIDL